jgi:hypothetical protein
MNHENSGCNDLLCVTSREEAVKVLNMTASGYKQSRSVRIAWPLIGQMATLKTRAGAYGERQTHALGAEAAIGAPQRAGSCVSARLFILLPVGHRRVGFRHGLVDDLITGLVCNLAGKPLPQRAVRMMSGCAPGASGRGLGSEPLGRCARSGFAEERSEEKR